MKRSLIIIIMCLVASVGMASDIVRIQDKWGNEVPNLNDYVFKMENGVLYYCEKNNYTSAIYTNSNWYFDKDVTDEERQNIMEQFATKEYQWKKEIPGLLMKELLNSPIWMEEK